MAVKVIRGFESPELHFDRSVLSIGNFDGVHRGHQQLLAQGAVLATNENAPLMVLTFEPHPLAVLRPADPPQRIMRLDDKLDLLAQHDVDVAVVAASTGDLLGLEAERFVAMVVEKFHPTHIVEGTTFGFGRGRRGNPDTLRALGEELGFEACIIPPVQLTIESSETVTVSSSVIRRLLNEGRVHLAALALGRPYSITGEVVAGAGRGRTLGFRTANVNHFETLLPADGVYAGTARVGRTKSLAGISIGTNLTFGGGQRKDEAHLLDFEREVIGERICIELGTWLREQRAFDSPEALREQIAADIEAVRAHGDASDATPFRRRGGDNGGSVS